MSITTRLVAVVADSFVAGIAINTVQAEVTSEHFRLHKNNRAIEFASATSNALLNVLLAVNNTPAHNVTFLNRNTYSLHSRSNLATAAYLMQGATKNRNSEMT